MRPPWLAQPMLLAALQQLGVGALQEGNVRKPSAQVMTHCFHPESEYPPLAPDDVFEVPAKATAETVRSRAARRNTFMKILLARKGRAPQDSDLLARTVPADAATPIGHCAD